MGNEICDPEPLDKGQSVALGIEKATVQAPQITRSGSSYTPAPDVIVRYRFDDHPDLTGGPSEGEALEAQKGA